jgi:hypothetical protein
VDRFGHQAFMRFYEGNPLDSFAYKKFGNSVSVPVVETVFSDFIEQNRTYLNW